MPAITLEFAKQQLALYLAAESAVLLKQSYEIAGRKLTYADLANIQKGVEIWSERASVAQAASSGRGRTRTIISR